MTAHRLSPPGWLTSAAKVLLGYLVIVEGVLQGLYGRVPVLDLGRGSQPIPREIVLSGLVVGCLYALVGMGLILVYRANRIINFAQAQLGAVPAVVALFLVSFRGVPYLAVIPIVLVGGALFGGVTEVVVIRRFSQAPRLILTVATVGIGLVLLVLEFYSKLWVSGSVTSAFAPDIPTPLGDVERRIGIVTFNGNHLMAVAVTVAAMALLGAFLRYTDIGIAARASAENADRAQLLGIPVRRVSTVVWMVAGTLSAIGVFLRGPLVGLPVGGFTGPSVLLFGLTVAVLARMDNLPHAVLGGLLVGVVQQVVAFSTGRTALADLAMFVVVIAALLAQRGALTRALEVGTSTWRSVKDIRPIPVELRNRPEVRRARLWLYLLAGLVVLIAPTVLGGKTGEATIIVLYSMIGVSLVVLTGWAGQISLGQYAIAGVGAAAAGGLAANHGWDFFLTLLAGALSGLVVAVAVGLPALRVQGLLLAVTTLAFAFAVQTVLSREYLGWLLPESGRIVNRPVLWGRLDLEGASELGPVHVSADAKYFFVCVLFLVAAICVARSFRNRRSGRVLIAVRDNAPMAQAFGIDPVAARVAAFAVSGFLAGLAGALLAYQDRVVASNAFPPERSIEVFLITVIGGVGSLPGALLGALYVRGVPLLPGIRDIDQIGLATNGIGILVLLYFMPGGLAEGMYRLRDGWLRRLASRHDIVVPSLLADGGTTPLPQDPANEPARTRPGAIAPALASTLLSCRGVHVAYDKVEVLFGVDLDVREGECVALLGTNGAGKSTLLRAISGLVDPTAGSVIFDGVDVTHLDAVATTRAGVIQVPGGRGVFPTLTVAEHLRLASWPHRDDAERVDAAAGHVYQTFPRLLERQHEQAGNLSGGEQQMLAVAMALVASPRLLIIDELSLGLAPTVVEQLLEIVRGVLASGVAVLIVEQSINVALTLADRAYFLEKGEVRFHGPTAELLDRDDIVRSVFLDGAARPGGRRKLRASPVQPQIGAVEAGRVALEVRGLRRTFGGVVAVDDVSFTVHRGEVVGLIGPNGAGKTTILDLVSGFVRPDAGRIILAGVDVTEERPDRRAMRRLGRSFQDARLVSSLTVAENLAIGFERHLPPRDHLAAALGLPGLSDAETQVAWSVADVIELLGLEAYRDKFVGELSTGTRRIVDLGLCVAHAPDVLLLDEPSSGIAQRETEALAPLLRRIQTETGCSLLVIEHDMRLIAAISDRMIALDRGRPIAVGTPAQVMRDPRVVSSYLGTDRSDLTCAR